MEVDDGSSQAQPLTLDMFMSPHGHGNNGGIGAAGQPGRAIVPLAQNAIVGTSAFGSDAQDAPLLQDVEGFFERATIGRTPMNKDGLAEVSEEVIDDGSLSPFFRSKGDRGDFAKRGHEDDIEPGHVVGRDDGRAVIRHMFQPLDVQSDQEANEETQDALAGIPAQGFLVRRRQRVSHGRCLETLRG